MKTNRMNTPSIDTTKLKLQIALLAVLALAPCPPSFPPTAAKNTSEER